jgi:hypothetical protein
MYRSSIATLATTALLIFGAGANAQAQQNNAKAVYTAGAFGAYHTLFCSALLIELEKGKFSGYACTPSGGSPDNIAKVLADPRSIGLAQLDVLARWSLDNTAAAKSLVVVRTLACEGLFMVTQSKDMATTSFAQIVGLAHHLKFAVADGGSRASCSSPIRRTPTSGCCRSARCAPYRS